MAKLSRSACRGLIYRYFLREGWLPPGTTKENWDEVTMGKLLMDDPPLPTDADFQKRGVALDLQSLFFVLGRALKDPFKQLKKKDSTLGDFADWCHENHE